MGREFGSFGEVTVDGSGALYLAPDLDFVSNSTSGVRQVLAIDATGSLTNVLSLSGRYVLSVLLFQGLTNGDMNKVKLTIDGEDIWFEDPLTPPSGTTLNLIGGIGTGSCREDYIIESSLDLSIEMATDTDISMQFLARPIL